MKKILFLLGILLFLIPQLLLSQQGWVKDFPGPGEESNGNIIQTSDGNYVFSICATEGFGSGLDAGSYLIKLDIEGNILWTHNFLPLGIFCFRPTVLQTNDNGFLIYTRKDFDGNGFHQPYVIKLDENGNEEWADFYILGNPNFTGVISDIEHLSDGGFLIAGRASVFSSSSEPIRRLDSNFNTIWEKDTPPMNNLFSFIETPTGDLIGGGINGSLIKFDIDGNIIWEQTFPNFADEDFNKVFILPNGNITVFATTSDQYPILRQIQLDNNGNYISDKVITPNNNGIRINNIIQVEDGFIGTGVILSNIPGVGSSVYLLKTDWAGNTVWENKIKHANIELGEVASDIVSTPDNGFMGIAGFTFLQAYIFKTDSLGFIYPNQIIGKVGKDEQPNCLVDSLENRLSNWIVSAQNNNQTYYAATDSLGEYLIPVDTGNYVLSIHPPNNLWIPCEDSIDVSVTNYSTVQEDFPVAVDVECPLLVIDGSLPIARPCFDNNKYYVNYCNEGTITATDAYIEIQTGNELSYVSSSIALSGQNNNVLTFDIGDVEPGECGSFYVDFLVDCDATIGATTCISSHIYPDSFCITDPNWNGAYVELSSACKDSLITFYLENVGNADMPTANEYMVVEDAILLLYNNFQLLSGQIDSITIPANASSFTMIAEQVADAPGEPFPTSWVEGCGVNLGSFSMGFINQFSLGDNIPYLDRDCRVMSSSYDPNDKQGFPLGYGDEHFIRSNTDLEYLIRFQNTGTDTAFTVVIRDTIASELDIPSIQVGASSHAYSWRVYGENVVEFTFNSIMLPDSNINEPASNGFVEFKISQKEDLPLGTVINNQAAIYFDYNDPIITNETYHTLGENFITVSLQKPTLEDYSLNVHPNPLQDFAIFEMKKKIQNGVFELYDVNGKQVWQQNFSGNQFELHRYAKLNSGIYFYKISAKGNAINSGKIIIN